jgi:hypothetical protein
MTIFISLFFNKIFYWTRKLNWLDFIFKFLNYVKKYFQITIFRPRTLRGEKRDPFLKKKQKKNRGI